MDTANQPGHAREIFCNRTLNLRAIRAIGYDMDYTLIHYHVEEWERRAYEYLRERLQSWGWPVEGLTFDPEMVIRGLIVDTDLGNLLKANRFGFVKKAFHGTQPLDFEAQRLAYARTIVDLSEPRWSFINTLFSLSEGCMYSQLVELLDQRKLPGAMGYRDLFRKVREAMDSLHMEGRLKADIIDHPERYVMPEPETALALLDQRESGKKLLLITNSEWTYTVAMMSFAFDRYLPKGQTWRDLFDVIVVGARKPDFFTHPNPFFEVATEEGLLRPHSGELKKGAAYLGGSAPLLERTLGLSGDEILYVGDHMFGDVHVTKSVLRWRTGLIVRELEDEVRAIESFGKVEAELGSRMEEKERIEAELCRLRLFHQRRRHAYGPPVELSDEALQVRTNELRNRLQALDGELAPLARAASEVSNRRWGLLTRAGNDKSHLARQIERYADIYTSRVSNFLYATPYVYLRSRRGSLPHDPTVPGATPVSAGG